eukprot:6503357-Lingulodinium_polyedra.AAC.1
MTKLMWLAPGLLMSTCAARATRLSAEYGDPRMIGFLLAQHAHIAKCDWWTVGDLRSYGFRPGRHEGDSLSKATDQLCRNQERFFIHCCCEPVNRLSSHMTERMLVRSVTEQHDFATVDARDKVCDAVSQP